MSSEKERTPQIQSRSDFKKDTLTRTQLKAIVNFAMSHAAQGAGSARKSYAHADSESDSPSQVGPPFME